jgi:hypothetical protein
MDEPALRFINGYDFAVFGPDDGELQEKICLNFVQNWTKTKPVIIFILSGARLLIIYILHNNICLMCLIIFCVYNVLLCLFILISNFNISYYKIALKLLIIIVLCVNIYS